MYLYLLEEASGDTSYYLMLIGILWLLIHLLKKDISNPIDPIVLCLISFSSITSLIIWLFLNGHIQIIYLFSYLLCASMFIVGFYIATNKKKNLYIKKFNYKLEISYEEKNNIDSNIDLKQLKTICHSIVVLVLITLALAATSNALAILSDSPVLDRVAISTANRWFTVIFSGYNPIGLALSIIIFVSVKKMTEKFMYLVIIIIFLGSFASGGSKGSILPALLLLGSVISYMTYLKCKIPKVLNKMQYSFALLGVSYFVFITSLPGTGDVGWASKLLTRIVGSGDNYIYFFVEDQCKKLQFTYNIVSYVAHTFTAPFGIKLISNNIGTEMYGLSTGDYSGFGPNPGYVVEGIIFFGMYLAPIYSLAIGYLTNYTRNMFVNKSGNLNLIFFIIFSCNAPTLPIDINLYIFNILSSIMLTMPIYYLSKILRMKSLTT